MNSFSNIVTSNDCDDKKIIVYFHISILNIMKMREDFVCVGDHFALW